MGDDLKSPKTTRLDVASLQLDLNALYTRAYVAVHDSRATAKTKRELRTKLDTARHLFRIVLDDVAKGIK